MSARASVTAVIWLVAQAFPALAQTSYSDPSADARLHLGPLAITPTLSLNNAGVDTNVFNDSAAADPKRDGMFVVTPAADMWLHVGRSILSGTIKEDLVYYQKYASERSTNGLYRAGIFVPLTRIELGGNVTFTDTHGRPGYEIDARAHHRELAYDGTVEVLAFSKTFFGVHGAQSELRFDQGETFLGSDLRQELNHRTDGLGVTLRYQATLLTAFIFEGRKERERFDFSDLRDSDSTEALMTVRFDPAAILKGSATVGYRDFQPRVPGVPKYTGTTARVNLRYVAAGSTRISGDLFRDIQYSYDVNQPYYLQTGFGVSVEQQIFGPIDLIGRGGIQRLDYRDRADAVVLAPDRTDHVHSYGGGVGIRAGRDTRIGFNLDHDSRESVVAFREYTGWKYGTTVTYGF